MTRTIAAGLCVVALGVAIWFSPGKQQPTESDGDQANAERQTSIGRSDTLPASTANADHVASAQEENREPPKSSAWFSQPSAPDWVMVVVTVFGLGIAIYQVIQAKEAVLKTERGDVLVESITKSTKGALTNETEIRVAFKNFGPTRANNLRIGGDLLFAEIVEEKTTPTNPSIVLAAGDSQNLTFEPLGKCMTQTTAQAINAGEVELKLVGWATYDDVFGKTHKTRAEAIYRSDNQRFQITKNEAD